jgi:hypothetical protein
MSRHSLRDGDATTLRVIILGLMLLLVAVGCSEPAAQQDVRALDWSRIALPAGVAASSLAVTPSGLLVGGRSSTRGDHPVLFVVDASGTVRPVPLHPNSPYAKVADLVSLASQGEEVVALGVAHGGAHANFRWTVWSGSTTSLVDYPQTFETFGGQSAGGLLDIVFTPSGPEIAGTWAARTGGLDAAVWLPSGHRWVRQNSAGTALANTPQLQVAPRAASGGSIMIISGSVITFDNGVQQRAAVWMQQNQRAAWTLLQLPVAGSHSEALSSSCDQQCWISGYADGVVAVWSVDAAESPEKGTRDSSLPRIEHNDEDASPVTIMSAGRPALLASHAGTSRLLVNDSQGWRSFAGPTGPVIDATTVGDRLYAIARASDGVELWTTDLAGTRNR